MSTTKEQFGTATAATITLASLANGAGRAMTAVDNSTTGAIDVHIKVKIKTASSGVSTTGYLSVYLLAAADGTEYDDAFAGSDAAFTPVNAYQLEIIQATANSTTYVKSYVLSRVCGFVPKKWAIAVVNNTGAALDSTAGNHEVKYEEITLATA